MQKPINIGAMWYPWTYGGLWLSFYICQLKAFIEGDASTDETTNCTISIVIFSLLTCRIKDQIVMPLTIMMYARKWIASYEIWPYPMVLTLELCIQLHELCDETCIAEDLQLYAFGHKYDDDNNRLARKFKVKLDTFWWSS